MNPHRHVASATARRTLVDNTDPWFRRYPVDAPVARLVCLPHAGGTAGVFHHLAASLAPGIELLAVQYPGRQDRLEHSWPRSLEHLAEEIAARLPPYLDVPVAVFGHSLGASVAYETARRIEDWYPGSLTRVCVSGRAAPSGDAYDPGPLDDEALVDWAIGLGGPGSEVYTDPGLRALLLPALRGDLRLLRAYRPAGIVRLKAPVTAFGGAADPTCPPEELATWADVTASGFDFRIFQGDHFYLVPQAAALAAEISSRIRG